jgi:tetratricopeptide (TPR) repeat protein
MLASLERTAPDVAIRLWDLASTQSVEAWREQRTAPSAMAFSPDGKLIASATDKWTEHSIPGELKLRDAHTGALMNTFRVARGPINAIAFSADSAYLAWSEEGGVVHLFDVSSGQEAAPLQCDAAMSIKQLIFTSNRGMLVIKSSNPAGTQIRIWDAANPQTATIVVQVPRELSEIALSPNGRWLAAGDTNHTIHIWDTASWEERPPLPGHSKSVTAVAFFPDSQRLASASNDQTIKLWDLRTSEDLLTLHTDVFITTLAISPDGRQIASAGNERIIRLWDATPLDEAARERREALSLLKFLCNKRISKQELEHHLQTDPTIGDSVRRQALAMAATWWENRNRDKAEVLVASLTYSNNARPKAEVLEAIRADHSLVEPVRQYALTLAEQYQENAEDLNWASHTVLSHPNRDAEAYRLALRQAQRAHELDPKNGDYLTSVGIAHYRLTQYAEALKALAQAGQLYTAAGTTPANLAFLAMTQQQLGNKDEAKKTFEHLRAMIRNSKEGDNPETRACLREASGYFPTVKNP